MSLDELEVLASLDLRTTEANTDVWRPPSTHVDGLHTAAIIELERRLDLLKSPESTNPSGLVVRGEKGVGKTHFVRYARDRVERADGYFVLVRLSSGLTFWPDTLNGMINSLNRNEQLPRLLKRLAFHARVPKSTEVAISGSGTPTLAELDAFIQGLRRHRQGMGIAASDTARALALLAADDAKFQSAGDAYFEFSPGYEEELRRGGIRAPARSYQLVVHELSLLMAQTGPTVFAVDQIDTLLAQSLRASGDQRRGRGSSTHEAVIDQVAHGLMELREETSRSVTVLACLPGTWEEIRTHAIDTAHDRFVVPALMDLLPSPQIAQDLVERRLAEHYREVGFQPRYPSWPVHPEAFQRANRYTPRALLQRIDEHIRACLQNGKVAELADLRQTSPDVSPLPVDSTGPARVRDDRDGNDRDDQDVAVADIDRQWAELLATVDPKVAWDDKQEDTCVPALLAAGLQTWAREESQRDGRERIVEPGQGARPRLHAQLRVVIDDAREDETHWSFRAIAASHHRAVQPRFKAAVEEAGLTVEDNTRFLVLLRSSSWPPGPVGKAMVADFRAAGGLEAELTDDDVRKMLALDRLLTQRPPGLEQWLSRRRPGHDIGLFARIFEPDGSTGSATATASNGRHQPVAGRDAAPAPGPSPPGESEEPAGTVTLGRTRREGKPFTIRLDLLRKHVLVVAGSGAGKTVLLKRLIEEVALQGVSSVVLDPNNDLSLLGEPWPTPPENWAAADSDAAGRYFRDTEVVVWTPRRSVGRQLAFEPLPDLTAFRSDPDEFAGAVEAAVTVLAARANVRGTTQKAMVARAVLTQVLEFHGRAGGGGLDSLITLLEDLPDEATTFDEARSLARSMATALRAARVTDPLFSATGTRTDPAELLTPTDGKRARVSVVNFVGLPRAEQRQSFVSQLQLALFAWIRRNPSPKDLGGLLVMDEAQDFAPAQGTTPASASTLQLAAQARKFGLGIAFATQAPRGLHNVVSGNTATQFIGRLTHPTQIDAAVQLARARGSELPDLARLGPGQFFAGTEGTGLTKIATGMSLSHHPAGPPSEEEILRLARGRTDQSPAGQ